MENSDTPIFTEVEYRIIKMIANEIPNKQIAKELNYS